MIAVRKSVYILSNILWLMLQILYYVCESAYYNLFGLEEKNVADEIVLITGTGHGIGKELAIQYARLGARVVCLDVNQQTNEMTVKEITETGKSSVYAYQCDVSNREKIVEVAERVREEIGDVTILINNAGIMPCHVFMDYTTDEIKRIFDINVMAHFWMLQAFLPSMIEKNYGHIVALSSIAGIAGIPYLVPYSATKFAVKGLMNSLNEELRLSTGGKSLIKFTTIFPYMVDTGLCKKPKIGKILPKFLFLKSPKDVAAQIISAQRRNIVEKTIPVFWLPCILYAQTLPINAQVCIRDFFDSGVEPDN